MKFGATTRSAEEPASRDPRRRVLDAAITCFGRSGFHNSSMQQICAEAGMSPGALYRYFPSKESIIAAIAEEDRQRNAVVFGRLASAPNFIDGLLALGQELLADPARPGCPQIGPEVMAEFTRNPKMRELFRPIEEGMRSQMRDAMAAAVARGEIDSTLDLEAVTTIFQALGDGLVTRLLMRPEQPLEALMPMIETLLRRFLKPQHISGHEQGNEENSSICATNSTL